MFDKMPISLIAAYSIFGLFVYYQQLHLRNFRGANQGFHSILTLFAFTGMLCGFAFLIYYGWTVRWYLPILLFVVGLVLQALWFGIEALLKIRDSAFIFSLLGFIVWPVAAVFMFLALPTSR